MPKYFPCPICRGEGEWIEPVTDEGQGPRYTCGYCEGQGMIEINGPLHQRIQRIRAANVAKKEKRK